MAENLTVTNGAALPPSEFHTLPEYLLRKAQEHAENKKSYFAIDARTKEKRYFNKFSEESGKIASGLYKLGLRKNGFVIYMPSEMIKLHIFLTGVWRANGICRASYPDDDPATLESRLKETNCSIILCDVSRLSTCKDAIKSVEWPVHIITTEKCDGYLSIDDIIANEDEKDCPALEISGEDPALILCTSGTTGVPKGAVLLHKTLVQHLHYFSLFPFTEDKPNLMFSTATHYSGSLFTFGPLIQGKTAIVTGKITKEILFEALTEFQPGLCFAFPTYLMTLVSQEATEYDFSSLEYLLTGGAMVTPAIKKALMELPNVKDLINMYGLSENGVVVTNCILHPEDPSKTTYSDLPDFAVGKPYPGVSIQIRHVDTLALLGPRDKGEICIKYEGNFDSYYKKPEATEATFIDGYLRSGDIGYYDEQGYIYVVDRLKEIFKYYNNHISPSDLENTISEHPLVDEVCVIGVADPGGDVPRAFVTIKGEILQNDTALVKEIMDFAHERLPEYKHLRGGLFILPELPKGKTGKITRALVAKIKV